MTQGTSDHSIHKMIDHTLLKPDALRSEIDRLCEEAVRFQFATVCVQPFRVAQAVEALKESTVQICTVIGFPFGANRAEIKAMETVRAVADGATELDMVINLGALKDGNSATVENDIKSVVKASQGRLVKVILETAQLSDDEIILACGLAENAGAQFVKTSTGFGKGGATVEAVRLMRKTVGQRMGVKASGGIRDIATMQAMIEAGASRIGTSHGVALVSGGLGEGDY